jgi:hypothetical protein
VEVKIQYLTDVEIFRDSIERNAKHGMQLSASDGKRVATMEDRLVPLSPVHRMVPGGKVLYS